MSADQFGVNGVLFMVLGLFLFLAADQSRSYTTKENCAVLGWCSVVVAVVSFLLAIWGEGWLYG